MLAPVGHFHVRNLAVVNVGGGADPPRPMRIAILGRHRHAPVPAVLAVGAPDALFGRERPTLAQPGANRGDRPLPVVGMDEGYPARVARRCREARVLAPSTVDELDRPVGSAGPHQIRACVGEHAIAGFAFPERGGVLAFGGDRRHPEAGQPADAQEHLKAGTVERREGAGAAHDRPCGDRGHADERSGHGPLPETNRRPRDHGEREVLPMRRALVGLEKDGEADDHRCQCDRQALDTGDGTRQRGRCGPDENQPPGNQVADGVAGQPPEQHGVERQPGCRHQLHEHRPVENGVERGAGDRRADESRDVPQARERRVDRGTAYEKRDHDRLGRIDGAEPDRQVNRIPPEDRRDDRGDRDRRRVADPEDHERTRRKPRRRPERYVPRVQLAEPITEGRHPEVRSGDENPHDGRSRGAKRDHLFS